MSKILRIVGLMALLMMSFGVMVTTAQDDMMVVRIGGIHPLTGFLANDGLGMDQAIQMAVDEINEMGLVPGITLEYVSADSTGAADVGQQEAERLITEEGISVIIGTFQSAVTGNVATVAAREGVPLIIDVAAASDITERGRDADGNQWTFRIQPNADVMGTFAAQYAVAMTSAGGGELGSVAYLHEGVTDYGRSVYGAFEAEAANIGLDIVETVGYEFGADYTTDVTIVGASAPDAVMVTGYYGDGLTIAQNMEAIALDVPFVMGVAQGTYDQDQFVADAGSLAECFFNSNYRWDNLNPHALAVRARYAERFGEGMTSADVLAWQATYIAADAIRRAGSGDTAAIQAALLETDYEYHIMPYDGSITFVDGETPNAIPVVMQVQDGAVKQVWPPEIAESEPRFCTSWGG
ncbi:MAG: ABC transporter substrate-binding protein [Anaerolineae bacterium]|nr:ABC transporter substrate-binding protein [Anaerolineae bacterium]MDQ7037432.1 ABC transporter substrate-binding protein [Anaerolineae bacterium]